MKLLISFAIFALFSGASVASNTDRYCNAIADMSKGYVEDRIARQPYQITLYTIDAAINEAGLSGAEKDKYRRDMRAAAKIAYIDFPKITQDGIYKLVRLGCMSE